MIQQSFFVKNSFFFKYFSTYSIVSIMLFGRLPSPSVFNPANLYDDPFVPPINVFRGSTILKWLPEGKVDMPEFLQAIRSNGGAVTCLQTSAMWRDLGRPEDLISANEAYLLEDH